MGCVLNIIGELKAGESVASFVLLKGSSECCVGRGQWWK